MVEPLADQVMARIEKLESAVKKPTVKRDEQLKELHIKLREGTASDIRTV